MAEKHKVDYPDFEELRDEYLPSTPSEKKPLEEKRKTPVALVDDSDEDEFDADKAKLMEMLRQAGTFIRGLCGRVLPIVLTVGGLCLLPLVVLKGLVFRKKDESADETERDNFVTKNSPSAKRDSAVKSGNAAPGASGKGGEKPGTNVGTGGTVVVQGKKKPLIDDFDEEDETGSRKRGPLRAALALGLIGAVGGAVVHTGIGFMNTTGNTMPDTAMAVGAEGEDGVVDEGVANGEQENTNAVEGPAAVFTTPGTAPAMAIPATPSWNDPPSMPTTAAQETPLPPAPGLWDVVEDTPSLPAFPTPPVPEPNLPALSALPAVSTLATDAVPNSGEPLNNFQAEDGAQPALSALSTTPANYAESGTNAPEAPGLFTDNTVDGNADAYLANNLATPDALDAPMMSDDPEVPAAAPPAFAATAPGLNAFPETDFNTPNPLSSPPGPAEENGPALLTDNTNPAYASSAPDSRTPSPFPNAWDNAAAPAVDAVDNVKMVRIDTPERSTPRVLTPSAPFDAEAVRAQTTPGETSPAGQTPMVSLATSLNENPPGLPSDPNPRTPEASDTLSTTRGNTATASSPLPFTTPQFPGNGGNALAGPEPETTLPHAPLGLPLVGTPNTASQGFADVPGTAPTIQEAGPRIPEDPNPVSVTDAQATPAAAASAISLLAVSAPRETLPVVESAEGARFSSPATLAATPTAATERNLPLPTHNADVTQPNYAVAESGPRYASAAPVAFSPLDAQPATSATLAATPYQAAAGTGSLGPLPQPGQKYTVPQNETYWTIAEHAYGSGRYYRALAIHNRSVVSDPRNLQGKQIEIPTLEFLLANYADESPARRTPGAATETASSATTRYYSTASPSPVPSPAAVERPSLLNASLLPGNSAVSGTLSSAGRDPQGTGQGMIYIVQEGDDLFSIAKNKLGDISLYTKIYALNKDKIGADGRSLIPGTELVLPINSQSSATLLRRF